MNGARLTAESLEVRLAQDEPAQRAASTRTEGEALNMIASVSQIESRMFLIRGQKVMLSPHLAELYEVEPTGIEPSS